MIWQQCRVFLDGNQQTTWWNKNTDKCQGWGWWNKVIPPPLPQKYTNLCNTHIYKLYVRWIPPSLTRDSGPDSWFSNTLSAPVSISLGASGPVHAGGGGRLKEIQMHLCISLLLCNDIFNFINVYISHTHIHTHTHTPPPPQPPPPPVCTYTYTLCVSVYFSLSLTCMKYLQHKDTLTNIQTHSKTDPAQIWVSFWVCVCEWFNK